MDLARKQRWQFLLLGLSGSELLSFTSCFIFQYSSRVIGGRSVLNISLCMGEGRGSYFLRPTGSANPNSPYTGQLSLLLLGEKSELSFFITSYLTKLFTYIIKSFTYITTQITTVTFYQTNPQRFLYYHYMLRSYKITTLLKHTVANQSEKQYRYSFETAYRQKIVPIRSLDNGTDRLLVTPNLIALADHGKQSAANRDPNLDDQFTTKLLSVINKLFNQEVQTFCDNLYKLASIAVEKTKIGGSSTLTLAAIHPYTGTISFYYVGDSLYGIFRQENVQMVQGQYDEAFNLAKTLGKDEGYPPEVGFSESFTKKQISKEDVIVIASNGLWNNVNLKILHNETRGPGSFVTPKNIHPDAVGRQQREPKSLKTIAERLGSIGAFYASKGNYESPLYLSAKKQNINYPKQGFLDDVSVILARRKKDIVIKSQSSSKSL